MDHQLIHPAVDSGAAAIRPGGKHLRPPMDADFIGYHLCRREQHGRAANDTGILIASRTIHGIGGGGINTLVDIVICDLVPSASEVNMWRP